MTQANQIFKTTIENKSAEYMKIVTDFAKQACDIFRTTESFLAKNSAKEVISSFRKCEAADCEFTLYVNAHAAEIWLENAIQFNHN